MKFEPEKVRSKLYVEFEAVFLKELNKHVPLKTKFLRNNNKPFMTNKILENKKWYDPNLETSLIKIKTMRTGKCQRNLCLNIL